MICIHIHILCLQLTAIQHLDLKKSLPGYEDQWTYISVMIKKDH